MFDTRACSLNCCALAPLVGFEDGDGKVTRTSVPPDAVWSVAVRKLVSGVSGSSWIRATVPVRFVLEAIASGDCRSNVAHEDDGNAMASATISARALSSVREAETPQAT